MKTQIRFFIFCTVFIAHLGLAQNFEIHKIDDTSIGITFGQHEISFISENIPPNGAPLLIIDDFILTHSKTIKHLGYIISQHTGGMKGLHILPPFTSYSISHRYDIHVPLHPSWPFADQHQRSLSDSYFSALSVTFQATVVAAAQFNEPRHYVILCALPLFLQAQTELRKTSLTRLMESIQQGDFNSLIKDLKPAQPLAIETKNPLDIIFEAFKEMGAEELLNNNLNVVRLGNTPTSKYVLLVRYLAKYHYILETIPRQTQVLIGDYKAYKDLSVEERTKLLNYRFHRVSLEDAWRRIGK